MKVYHLLIILIVSNAVLFTAIIMGIKWIVSLIQG